MNYNNLIVFDLETGGANPLTAEIIQVAAVIINRNNLKIIDEFEAKMRPENLDAVEDGALQVTGFTKEQLKTFGDTSIIWPTFTNWVNKHNKKNSVYTAPIPAGYNILGYDMPIINRYCKKYKTSWDETRQQQKLFSQVYKFDVLDHLWFWFENVPDLEKLKLEYVLTYMGASAETVAGSHDAMNDVKNTAAIIVKLFKMQRYMTELRSDTGTRRLEMKGSMKNA